MTIKVVLRDGTVLYPAYDPEHRKGVIEFYADKFEKGLIREWGIVE